MRGFSVVLEVEKANPERTLEWDLYTVRLIRKSPDLIRKELTTPGYAWTYTLETGFGTFAHAAAKAVSGRAKSEEEAMLLAAAAGHPPSFVFRMDPGGRFTEILDTESGKPLWRGNLSKPPAEEKPAQTLDH